MKIVFTNNMVAHIWANQSQNYGRSANGQFYFEGKRLYSYGPHFLVAMVFAPNVYLLNSDSYSLTTHRHQSLCRNAISSDATEFYIRKLGEMVNASFLRDEFSVDSFVSYYGSLKPSAWSIGLDNFLTRVAPKRAPALIKARIKRFDSDAKKAAKAALIANQAKAKTFIAYCKDLGGEYGLDRETVKFTPLNSNWERVYGAQIVPCGYMARGINYYDHLPSLVRDINQWLVHCRKYGNADQTKRYVWPMVKAWRAHLQFKRERLEKDNAQYSIKSMFTLIKEALAENAGNPIGFYREVRNYAHRESSGYQWFEKIFNMSSRSPIISEIKECYERGHVAWVAEQEALDKARDKADREKKAVNLEAWKRGDSIASYKLPDHHRGHEFAYLRIKGDEVQTSRGASVPLDHAIKLYRFMRAIKQPWEGVQQVGYFTLTSINDNVATIGCHKLHLDDMQTLADLHGILTNV